MSKRGRKPTPCPIDFAVHAATMTVPDLGNHYSIGNAAIKRWLAELGLAAFVRKCDPVHPSKGATWQALNTVEKIEAAKTPRKLAGFWAKVRKSDGCWTWTSKYYNSRGYGQFSFGGFNMNAHRAAWMIYNGPIPADMHVLHRCDNPRCVRPDHLFLGSNQDNYDDRDAKGRVRHGSTHPRAKLTEALVIELRASNESDAVWAERMGMHATVIRDARSGKKWKRVPGANPGFYDRIRSGNE